MSLLIIDPNVMIHYVLQNELVQLIGFQLSDELRYEIIVGFRNI